MSTSCRPSTRRWWLKILPPHSFELISLSYEPWNNVSHNKSASTGLSAVEIISLSHMFATEIFMHLFLLSSVIQTLNPEEADLFYNLM